MNRTVKRSTPLLLAIACGVAGCSTAYYGMWEKLGYEKRDILVSRVEKARDDQDAAAKQFQTTLERFKEVTHYNGGDLEAEYDKLKAENDAAVARAQDVRDRIAKVEEVAADMFAEWKSELSQYQDQNLRAQSQQKLDETQQKYDQLIARMKASAARMDPVLRAFNDQVLFLKHNLNASAIASLSTTASQIDTDVQSLVNELQASIKEADAFIDTMKKQ